MFEVQMIKWERFATKKFLMKFEIIFLLKPFSSQFNFSDILCNILQTNALDVMFFLCRIPEIQ